MHWVVHALLYLHDPQFIYSMFFWLFTKRCRVRRSLTQQMCSQLMQKFIVTFGTGGNSCCTLCATLLATFVEPHSFSLEVPTNPTPNPNGSPAHCKAATLEGLPKRKTWKTIAHTLTLMCVSLLCSVLSAALHAAHLHSSCNSSSSRDSSSVFIFIFISFY